MAVQLHCRLKSGSAVQALSIAPAPDIGAHSSSTSPTGTPVGTSLGDADQRTDAGFVLGVGTDSPSSPYPLLPANSPDKQDHGGDASAKVLGGVESSREVSRSPVSLSLRPMLSLNQESGESLWCFGLVIPCL